MGGMGFWQELKRRHVYRVAAAYAVVGWLLIQIATQVFPFFKLPDWSVRLIVLAILIGFPIALVLAWAFDVSPAGGIRRVTADGQLILNDRRHGMLAVGVIGVLLAALTGAGWWWSQRVPASSASAASVAFARAAAVTKASARSSTRTPAPANTPIAGAPIPAKSVAVLPFLNESGNKDQQYFSDGLSEDLITALSQFPGLKVINRNSSFQFRNSKDSVQAIGKKLGVAHLLEGSVRRLGGEVRISAELVNVADGSTLWSQHYDRPYKDLFALQDVITKAVSDALKAKLMAAPGASAQSDRPPSGSLAAYNDYLQAEFYARRFTEANGHKAIGFLEKAIQADPRYALAWARLANAWAGLAGNLLGGPEAVQAWDKARVAIRTSLSLDPDLAAAHHVNTFILSSFDHDWKGAEAEAERAYQLAPNKYFATLADRRATLGQPRQAVELIRRGLPNDPLCSGCYSELAMYLPALGRLDEAVQAARKALELAPGNYFARMELVYFDVQRGDAAAALEDARKEPSGPWRDSAMAFALQIGPDRAVADAALQTLIAKQAGNAAYQIAEIYALRKDPGNMFKWLERANANHDPGINELLYDAPVLRYKNDPRFAAFCRKVGLPTTTDTVALP